MLNLELYCMTHWIEELKARTQTYFSTHDHQKHYSQQLNGGDSSSAHHQMNADEQNVGTSFSLKKRNEVLIQATAWMEDILLSEIS